MQSRYAIISNQILLNFLLLFYCYSIAILLLFYCSLIAFTLSLDREIIFETNNTIFCCNIKKINFYLFLYSKNLFAFDFSIVVIIVDIFLIDFTIVYTIVFLTALLILLRVFIESLLVQFSTIRPFFLYLLLRLFNYQRQIIAFKSYKYYF